MATKAEDATSIDNTNDGIEMCFNRMMVVWCADTCYCNEYNCRREHGQGGISD